MSQAKKITFLALLLGAALILSYVEALVPLGAFKIGLPNVAVLLICKLFSRRMGLLLSLARISLSTLLFGSVTAFAFSLGGGILAWILIALTLPFYGKISFIGISVLAAAAHNFGQTIAACFVFGSVAPLAMLWWLLLLAVPAGILTGMLAQIVCGRLTHLLNGGKNA